MGLQQDATEEEAQRHGDGDGGGARYEEGVVEDRLTDTGGAGVIHFDCGQQGRVGRQYETGR